MSLFSDPFNALLGLQRALDSFQRSAWLQSGLSSSGSYPPCNGFRQDEDFVIISELPGIKRSDLDVQVKGNTVRIAGSKSIAYPEKAGVHRRERLSGRFDRALTLPVAIDPEGVKAEYRDGLLAVLLPQAEHDKPKSITVG